jgi:hypothetical protein
VPVVEGDVVELDAVAALSRRTRPVLVDVEGVSIVVADEVFEDDVIA